MADNIPTTKTEANDYMEKAMITPYLPTDYVDMALDDIPHAIRAVAWAKLMGKAETDGGYAIAESTLNMVTNFRLNRSGFDADSNIAKNMIDMAYRSSGSGGYYNQLQNFVFSLDKYNSLRIPTNIEFNGPMFITRPRLCMQTSNLRNHRSMASLDTMDPNSMAFMIRALLDTNLHKANKEYTEAYTSSSLFDYQNPFMTPLCNAVSAVSGLPDLLLETATTQGGFMAEAQQFVVGGDNLQRASYQLNLTFRDVQYGPVAAIFYFWVEYIRCVTRGYMMPYADDIDQQRMNYTVSLYLFNLDYSRKYITHWCKCTGCFPTAFPIGAIMNREYNGAVVKAAGELSIPFVCNIVEYMDSAILTDFNSLVCRYCPDLNLDQNGRPMEPDGIGKTSIHLHPPTPDIPIFNLTSMPYISSDPHGVRLEWRLMPRHTRKSDLDLGVLEMLQQNNTFRVGNNSMMKPVNEFYYPGFSEDGKKFNLTNFADYLTKVINTNKQGVF